jgi:hypothetical protein
MRSQATDIGAVPAPVRRDPQFDLSYGNKEIILCAARWRRELALMGRPVPSATADTALARRGSDFRRRRSARAKLMTGLVQGVVQNEPLTRAPCTASAHAIVLERNIAECGGCRASDSLETVSRTMPGRNASEEQILALNARAPRPLYEDRTEPIWRRRYEIGTNTEVDIAIKLYRLLEASQKKDEWASFTDCYAAPAKIVGRTAGKGDGS